MTLGDLKIALNENYQLEEDAAARVVMKQYTGCSMNNKKVRYIVDNDAAVPTQDVLHMKGDRLVVRMKKNVDAKSATGYHVMFQYFYFLTTLEATALARPSQNAFQCSRMRQRRQTVD